jgi:hypothetical protein
MAQQGTTAAAFTRLRPLEGTNTGAIVEEHIRFWEKNKGDKEAAKLAREAKANEFKRKVAKQTFDTYKGLEGQEAAGYFTEQIVNYKNENAEKWVDLAKKINTGDENAIILYAKEKEKLRNLINASKVVAAKSAELVKQKADGTFNEHLDSDLLDFNEQLARSNYALDPKLGKFRIYDKNNPNVLLEVDPLKLTNEYLSANFNQPVDFTSTGSRLAKGLLDSIDGNKQITQETNVRGVQLALNEFSQDPVIAKSWYRDQQKKGLNSNTKTFEELDDGEFNNLAASFYQQSIKPNISETTKDTELEDAGKRQALINAKLEAQRKRQLLKKGAKEATEGETTIEITTTEEGNTISREITASGQPVSTEILGETMFTIKGGFSVDEVEGDKDTRTTYTNFARGKDGIVAIGTKTTKTPVLDEDGKQVIDDDGVVQLREETISIVEKDKTKLGNIATRITNKEGETFKNLTELNAELINLEGELTKTTTVSAKTFTEGQEKSIQDNMDANPDYSREEIIKALGF